MYLVTEVTKFEYSHQRSPKVAGNGLCIIPPRNGRKTFRTIFAAEPYHGGYNVGDWPDWRCSVDVPRWLWEQKNLTRVFVSKNPFRRCYSLWLSAEVNKLERPHGRWRKFDTFLEWLTAEDNLHWSAWPQTLWMGGRKAFKRFGIVPTRKDDKRIQPPLDPEYVIDVEALGEGLFTAKMLFAPLEEIPYLRSYGERQPPDRWKADLTPKAVKVIRRHFAQDFEELGYSRKLEDA